MHILVVDDDPLTAELVVAILEHENYQCTVAEQALAALEILEQDTTIDVIISDLHMPLMNGIELFQQLKSQGSQLPFILLTGDVVTCETIQHLGLAGCLEKDFSLEHNLPKLLLTARQCLR
jgi:CheY-like chemotaxis protein